MLLIRFKANVEDYRPVLWPAEHPFWCSGYGEDYSIVISYANDEDYIYENWPEAKDLEIEEVNGYVFTERFPKPGWFDEDKDKLEESPISYFDFMPHGEYPARIPSGK